MPKLPRVTARQLLRALKKLGFQKLRQKGSHLTLQNPGTGRVCTVPVHVGETLAPKTLQSILKQADVSLEEFLENL